MASLASLLARRLTYRQVLIVILTNFVLYTTVSQAVQETHCQCPSLPGYITYSGHCPDVNSLMVVKRTLMARTHNASIASFCNQEIQIQSLDCVLEDVKSSWPVRSACNAKNGTCLISYTLDTQGLGVCPHEDNYIYACLQYECVTNSRNPNVTNARVYMASSVQPQSYEMGSSFHLMTSYYPSALSSSRSYCTLRVANSANVLLRLQDLRSRFIGAVGAGNVCPYKFYINSGIDYKQWCTTGTWTYEELRVNSTQATASGFRYIDLAFYSEYSQGQTEGAAWITVESSGEGVMVQCGGQMYNGTGHSDPTTTTTTTTTRTTTTTTTRQPISPSQSSTTTTTTRASSSSSTRSSTTTSRSSTSSTSRSSSLSSSTTTRSAPPGPISSSTRPPVGPTGSPGIPSTTRTPVGPPGPLSSSTRPGPGPVSSSVMSSSSSVRVSGPPTVPGPTSTTRRAPIISPNSFTPGVPTPGVPPIDREAANSVQAYTYTNDNTVRVAIAVTVIVVGVILIALIIMALIWFFKWRNNDSGSDRRKLENEYDSTGEGAYEQ